MRRHIYPLAALLALTAILLAALPAEAQTVTSTQPAAISLFGMNTYFTGRERISRDGDAGVATLIAKGRQIGVAWAREELSWGNIEREGKGLWQWDDIDIRIGAAAQAGYGVVGMLLTTPAWARVGDCGVRTLRYIYAGVRAESYWCPPASPQDFADYVRATVERYDGDGVDDAPGSPRVAAWQIWNEPNAWETWPGSPAEFAAIWQAGYSAARAADPTAVVASPGLYVFDGQWQDGVGHGDGLRFFDEALAARPSLWGSFDALAVHPYMPDVAPDQPGLYGSISLWGRLSTARAWLDEHTRRYGGPPKPLWVSEVGWSTCTAAQADCYAGAAAGVQQEAGARGQEQQAGQPTAFLGPMATGAYTDTSAPQLDSAGLAALVGKSEDQQASYLVRAYGLAMAAGVQHMSWFQLEDKFDGSAHNFWEEAAIFGTAAEGYRAKPAAQAYAAMSGLLTGASFLGFGGLSTFAYSPAALSPQARFHLRFLTADNRLVDLLWRNSGVGTVYLPLEPGRGAELLDRAGAAQGLSIVGGAAQLALSESPIYLIQSISPGLTIAPASLDVHVQPDDPPQQLSIVVANSGSGAISWAATTDAAWADVQTPAGQGYRSLLRISLSPAGLRLGSYSAILRVSSSAGTSDIPLRMVVSEHVYRRYLPFVGR
ncbi:hypothetical protein K2Z83_18970 [Oscillochloris sp. ZM17-4]|uniref:hypothetical protein n=1 Tax=Oscillochloris sp. ZM17-4 TaxID=2866714 RepID=UPI001C72ACDF|nr:hypothetical protein [Oscillochloris sp. ZM17-4]MBX0329756.1 hypothetical protein [Oscillochloris sp. ZM17-4]